MSKKRGHGEGSIDTRGENAHRLRYRVDGKRHIVTFRGSRTDARAELRRLLKSADDDAHIAPTKLTLDDWIDQWLALLERKPADAAEPKPDRKARRKRGLVSTRTLERYSDLLRLHVRPKLGARPLRKITGTEIDTLYVEREQVLAPRTVHHIHVALKACLSVAVRKKLIASNPAADAEAPTYDEGQAGRVLDEAELSTVLQAFKGRALYPLVLTLALTGARLNEALALQWADINFEAKTLSIVRAIEPTKRHGRRIKAPKTVRGIRTITIDDALVNVLRDRRNQHLRLVAGIPDGVDVDLSLVRLPEGALIFPGGGGIDLLQTRNCHGVETDWRERLAKIGMKGFRLHDLRGTHSTMLLDRGVGVHVVAARIGDDPATLLRIYAKRTRKADSSAAATIADISARVLAGTT